MLVLEIILGRCGRVLSSHHSFYVLGMDTGLFYNQKYKNIIQKKADWTGVLALKVYKFSHGVPH